MERLAIQCLEHCLKSYVFKTGSHPVKSGIFCQIFVDRIGIFSANVDFGRKRESYTETKCAKLMDLFICAGFLFFKLIAGETQNYKAFITVCLKEFFQTFILR